MRAVRALIQGGGEVAFNLYVNVLNIRPDYIRSCLPYMAQFFSNQKLRLLCIQIHIPNEYNTVCK